MVRVPPSSSRWVMSAAGGIVQRGECTTNLVQTAEIDLVYYSSDTDGLEAKGGERSGDGRREEVGNEVAHGILQRETWHPGALRHRGAAPGGGGPVGPGGRSRGISLAPEKEPAELVRAGRAPRGAGRKRVGPLPNREGERARVVGCRRLAPRGIEARTWTSNSGSSRSAISRSPS